MDELLLLLSAIKKSEVFFIGLKMAQFLRYWGIVFFANTPNFTVEKDSEI